MAMLLLVRWKKDRRLHFSLVLFLGRRSGFHPIVITIVGIVSKKHSVLINVNPRFLGEGKSNHAFINQLMPGQTRLNGLQNSIAWTLIKRTIRILISSVGIINRL